MNVIRDEVEQALLDLGWHIDRRSWDEVAALLDEQVRTDYTAVFGGEPQHQSGSALVEQWRGMLEQLAATQHLVTGVRVGEPDGSMVHATANVVGTHLSASSDQRMWTVGGWWEAVMTQRDGRFVVSALTLHPSWQTGDIGVMSGA